MENTINALHCKIDGCSKNVFGRGLCSMHHARLMRHGDPHTVLVNRNTETVCKVDGCELKVQSHNLCAKHYTRLVRHGDSSISFRQSNNGRICKARNCNNESEKIGFCSKHYQRYKKHGDPNKTRPVINKGRLCKIDGCSKQARTIGLCYTHYGRLQRHGNPNIEPKPISKGNKCKIDGCEKLFHAKGLCSTHYNRLRIHGDPLFKRYEDNSGKCKIEGCNSKAKSFGLCGAHYKKQYRYGDPTIDKSLYINQNRQPKEKYPCKHKGCKGIARSKDLCAKHYSKLSGKAPVSYKVFARKIGYAEYVEKGTNGELICKCTYCGKKITPSRNDIYNRIRGLEKDWGGNNLYCSDACKKSCPTYGAASHYKGARNSGSREVPAAFRHMALADRDYTCEKCGVKKNGLHVHHIDGYTELPMFAADLSNVMVVCKKCHRAIHKQPGCTTQDYKCQGRRKAA